MVLLVWLAAACGPEAADLPGLAPTVGGKADGPAVLGDGPYSLTLTSVARYRDPQGSEEWDLTTRVTALAMAGEAVDGATLTLQPCRVELPRLNGYLPRLPDETVAALPPVTAPLLIDEDEDGWTGGYVTGPVRIGLGLDPLHPAEDPLPADGSDPAVADDDGDGEPGVTVHVSLFEIYLVARIGVTLQGQAEGGTADVRFEQEILGDSIPFYDAAEAAAEAAAQNELLHASHSFRLEPTMAQSCFELLGAD